MMAQQIERRLHVKVERKLNLGGTLLAHRALVNGEIDLYPEYTGTALTAVLKQHPMQDPAAVLNAVRALYRERVEAGLARAAGLRQYIRHDRQWGGGADEPLEDDLGCGGSSPLASGVGYEFAGRQDGLDGLLSTYGIHMAAPPPDDGLGLLYTAIQSKQVDMIAASATDGQISKMDVTVLQDDKHYFPAVSMRSGGARSHGGAAAGTCARRSRNYRARSPMKKCAG